ncbi:MAG: hypothetical protein ACYCXI_07740 [Dethiobacteraceae bacterium]
MSTDSSLAQSHEKNNFLQQFSDKRRSAAAQYCLAWEALPREAKSAEKERLKARAER